MNNIPSKTLLRIGFATIYPWRPHVEHTWFLANLAIKAGHKVKFLTCDSDLPLCYSHLLRNKTKWIECLKCQLGGIRSFVNQDVSSLGENLESGSELINPDLIRKWSKSSASTLGRFESNNDYSSKDFNSLVEKLSPSVELAYLAARNWMIKEKLDAVCLFNGRIDVTAAIFEAAKSLNLPVVTHERTWFGSGIQLLPNETALGLKTISKMVQEWHDKPLLESQAFKAASLVARRFLKTNDTEWRVYNRNGIDTPWPVKEAKHRFLILPSSMNEIWGHADWRSNWESPLDALDAIISKLNLAPSDLVLRCHPNWAEKIGETDGYRSEIYYTSWAQSKNIHIVASNDNASTMNLIEECDGIIVSCGSAALEAGTLGKLVITTSPSIYHLAGFTTNIHGPDDLNSLVSVRNELNSCSERLPISINRMSYALRFAYTMVWRIPQYVDFVIPKKTIDYEYLDGCDFERFTRLFLRGVLEPDDCVYNLNGCDGEARIIEKINARKWRDLLFKNDEIYNKEIISVKRRFFYGWVDPVRKLTNLGDR